MILRLYNSLTCDPNTQSSSNTLFIVVVCRWFGFPSAFIFAAMKKKPFSDWKLASHIDIHARYYHECTCSKNSMQLTLHELLCMTNPTSKSISGSPGRSANWPGHG